MTEIDNSPYPPIIKPARLRKGDLAGVLSPAGPVEEAELQAGIRFLEESGYRVRLGRHALDKSGYLAGEDSARLDDLHAMFGDSEVRAIFCTRGGYGAMRLLDRIKYDAIREHPKIFAGFSDITALLLSIFARAGVITFHGPMVRQVKAVGSQPFAALLETVESSDLHCLEFPEARVLVHGETEGRLIGGNLCLISHLVGTSFLPSFAGCILFLEDTGEPVYRIDRMVTQLRLSGYLEGISGLIAGTFEKCGDRAAIDNLLADSMRDLYVPVVSGVSIGHGASNATLPVGVRARLDTASRSLLLKEPCVC
jgi:muramoyltetrapeptide carboxypeptidase